MVLTNQPLRQILCNPTNVEGLVKWMIELEEFNISYQPCSAIKVQVLIDVLVECTIQEAEFEP